LTGFIKIKLNNLYFLLELNYLSIMPMTAKQIKNYIEEALPDSKVEIEDLKGDGDHYSATVISKSFSGKTRVEQHKMVYDSLKGRMGNELHALKLKTLTE
tara:strand:+ start:1448 stop:1747 length:300 start_codon:yes stop_codon:yes gene_type:complete